MDTKANGLVMRTPLGWMAAAERGGLLVAVVLPTASKQMAMAALDVKVEFGGRSPMLGELEENLARYFAGERVDFSQYAVDLDDFPPFLRKALEAARSIPYGEVRTYGWLAGKAGNPKAARAAGQAMARNPVPLIVPCHRVVASSGGLGGYGGGLELKRALLELEGVELTKTRGSS
jgi:methylated-DNA-[protein]-cysteine S-methyltransferase